MKEDFGILRIQFIPTDFECIVIYSKYVDDIKNYLKENYYVNEFDYNLDRPGCDDLIHKTDGRQILIELSGKESRVIVHECVHAVMRWSRLIGQNYTTDNHELLAYWVEYLFEKINNWLNPDV